MNVYFNIIDPVGGKVVSTFAAWHQGETGDEWQEVILLALRNHCWWHQLPAKAYTLVQV